MQLLLLLFVGAMGSACIDDSREVPATGLIWLVDGCSISTYLDRLTTKIFERFHHPKVCAVNTKELYRLYEVDGFQKQGRINLVESKRQDNATFGHCGNKNRFVVGKLTHSNYVHNKTTDFDERPPPFIFTSAIRSNVPQYLACLLRDQEEHDFGDETGLDIETIGHLVDPTSGDKWQHKATAFRDDKSFSSAYLYTDDLPKTLNHVYTTIMLARRSILLDTHVDGTVYNAEDLITLNTDEKRRAAAELWVSILARGGSLANVDDVINLLKHETNQPCDIRSRIFNLDDLRAALNGTAWERTVYCPDEWSALRRSRRRPDRRG